MNSPTKIIVAATKNGRGLFARAAIAAGEVILEFEPRFLPYPTHTTLRIDEFRHQENHDPAAAENFINHSCAPNGYIDFVGLSFRALRDIRPGEELTYNYLTTDYDGEDVFACQCGSPDCFKHISGFKHLDRQRQERLGPYLSPYLKAILNGSK